MSKSTTKPKCRVNRLPNIWRLTVAGIEFTATAEICQNPGSRKFMRMKIRASKSLTYIPSDVVGWFQRQAYRVTGDLPCWVTSWYWGQWSRHRNTVYGSTPDAGEIQKSVDEIIEFTREKLQEGEPHLVRIK